ncbi:hypothetical protein [Micromonospora siamensis]|uniref:Uncharacterized protein n=1 Tax=Micromonospora siamensis TaxID=299152 RepID=A0A1C5HZ86_9ACTN|nr:hypothetical protein [Micromonospora siamensis]SCG51257.1 hypothetical protein GA0074704_2615 [Micromonospora siamensis]
MNESQVRSGETGLKIRFSYPAGPFADVYRSTRPGVGLNGSPPVLSNWGEQWFPVPAGSWAVKVTVAFGGQDGFGVAECVVSVGEGAVVDLEYRAPTVLGLSGTLRRR